MTVPAAPTLRQGIARGVARAEAAMAGFLGLAVTAELVELSVVDPLSLGTRFAESHRVGWGLYERCQGTLSGHCLLVVDQDAAPEWVACLLGQAGCVEDPPDGLTRVELFRSALLELGNVVMGAFLAGVADELGGLIEPTPPAGAHDLVGAIVGSVTAELASGCREALAVNVRFHVDGRPLAADLLLLPGPTMDDARCP